MLTTSSAPTLKCLNVIRLNVTLLKIFSQAAKEMTKLFYDVIRQAISSFTNRCESNVREQLIVYF